MGRRVASEENWPDSEISPGAGIPAASCPWIGVICEKPAGNPLAPRLGQALRFRLRKLAVLPKQSHAIRAGFAEAKAVTAGGIGGIDTGDVFIRGKGQSGSSEKNYYYRVPPVSPGP